jgi:hypothetical protein
MNSAETSFSRQAKAHRPTQIRVARVVPWWLTFWPANVQRQHTGDIDHAGNLDHTGDVTGPPGAFPAYRGGSGLSGYGNDAQVIERPDTSTREWALGFFAVIGEGATVAVTSQPQVLFRGERLVIPSTIAAFGGLAVVDIKVGNRSQLLSSQPIPAQVFEEFAVGVRLSLDTAQVAQDVTLLMKDLSGVGGTFTGALVGTAMF